MGSQNSVLEQEQLSPSPKPSSARRNRLKKPPTNTSLESPSSRPVFASTRRRLSFLESSPALSEPESPHLPPPTETDTVDLATPTRSPPPTTIIEEIAQTALSAGSPSPIAPGVLRRRSLLVAAPPGTVTRRGTKLSRHSLPVAVETRCITPSGYSVIGTYKRGSLRITNGAASPPASPGIPPTISRQSLEFLETPLKPRGGSPKDVIYSSSQGSLGVQPHEEISAPQYNDVPPPYYTAPPPPPMRTPPPIPSFNAMTPHHTTPPTIRHVHEDALDALEGRRHPALSQSVECTITTSRYMTPPHEIEAPQWRTAAQHDDVFAVQQTIIKRHANSVVQADYSMSATSTRFRVKERRSEQWSPSVQEPPEEVLDNSKITGQEYYRRFSRRRSTQQMIGECWS